MGQDNSQSWVRISYGTNKYVIDSNHNNTEALADPHEGQASQTSVKVIVARSKAKAKPKKREPVDVPSIIPMNERKWFDIKPAEPSLASYEVSKKVISLLRQNQQYSGKMMEQFNSGGLNYIFEIYSHKYWSDDRWKACSAAGGGSKRRYQCCSDNLGTIFYFRALQGHSGHNLIDPTLQDIVIIQRGLFSTYWQNTELDRHS